MFIDISKSDIPQLQQNVRLAAGSSKDFSADCYDETGGRLTLSPNTDFRGTIVIAYNYVPEVTGAPVRVAKAGITGTVIGE